MFFAIFTMIRASRTSLHVQRFIGLRIATSATWAANRVSRSSTRSST